MTKKRTKLKAIIYDIAHENRTKPDVVRRKIAGEMGKCISTIYNWESGKATPSIKDSQKLYDVLKTAGKDVNIYKIFTD